MRAKWPPLNQSWRVHAGLLERRGTCKACDTAANNYGVHARETTAESLGFMWSYICGSVLLVALLWPIRDSRSVLVETAPVAPGAFVPADDSGIVIIDADRCPATPVNRWIRR
jgi:hypothetical protein